MKQFNSISNPCANRAISAAKSIERTWGGYSHTTEKETNSSSAYALLSENNALITRKSPRNHPLVKGQRDKVQCTRGQSTQWLRYVATLLLVFFVGIGNAWGATTTITFISSNKNDAGDAFSAMSNGDTQLVGSGLAKLIATNSVALSTNSNKYGYRSDGGRLIIVFKFDGTTNLTIQHNANSTGERYMRLYSFSSNKALKDITTSDWSTKTQQAFSSTDVTTTWGSGQQSVVTTGSGDKANKLWNYTTKGCLTVTWSNLPAGYYVMDGTGSEAYLYGFTAEICYAPSKLEAGTLTTSGATLTVTDANDVNDYEFYVSTNSTAPTASSSAIYTSTSKTKSINDLSASTTYYAWVRSKCSSTFKSPWTALTGSTFTTESAAPSCDDPTTTFADGNCVIGVPLDLRNLVGSIQGDGAVSFEVKNANSTSATIAGDGYSLSATTAGTCTVTATQAADATNGYCEKSIDATITVSTAKRIYMECGSTWCDASPKFFVRSWDNSGNYTYEMALANCETDVYYADIPSGHTGMLFTRQNSSTSWIIWSGSDFWGQSQDITIGDDDLFTCTGWSNSKGNFSGSTYSAPTRTMTYNANGGSGNAPTDSNSPYDCGSTVTVLGNVGTPSVLTKAGYSFDGWNNKSDGSGTDFAVAGTFTINKDTTLYAKWKQEIPNSASVSGTWAYFPGQTVSLTAVPSGGTSDNLEFQWQKYVSSDWEDLEDGEDAEDGGTFSGVDAANLQISGCTKRNSGKYRCVISALGATITSSEYTVHVYTLEGGYKGDGSSWTAYDLAYTSGTSGSVAVNLNASSSYEFGIKDNYDNSWYRNTNFIISPWTNEGFGKGSGNCRLFTGPEGDYTFTVDIAHVGDGTPYVNVSVGYPSVTHPVEGYVYIPKNWSKCYVHYWYTDGGGDHALTSWGSDVEITTYVEDLCDVNYFYLPAIGEYPKVIIKDASGDPSNTTGDQTTSGNSGKYIKHDGSSWGWNSFTTYTVSFAGNGKTGGTDMSAVEGLCSGEDVDLAANTWTKTGHTFGGWKTNVALSYVPYGGGDAVNVAVNGIVPDKATIKSVGANITLTAQWTAETYDVTATLSNATKSSGTTGTNAATYNTEYSATFTADEGYELPEEISVTIDGDDATADEDYTWSIEEGVGTFTVPAANVTGDITIGITSTAKTYSITYNKGTYGTGTISGGSKTHGVAYTLSSSTFTRAGYVQTGWSLTDGGAKAYNLGGSYTTNAAQEFYPFWSEVSTYTATFSYDSEHPAAAPNDWTFSNAGTYGATDATVAYVGAFGETCPAPDSIHSNDMIAFAKNSGVYAKYDIGYVTTVTAVSGHFNVGSSSARTFTITYLGSDNSVKHTVTINHPASSNWGADFVNETTSVSDVRYIKINGMTSNQSWIIMQAFSVKYVDLATKYAVTHNLTNITATSGATGSTAATDGKAYNAVFAGSSSSYALPATITVTIGGETATAGTDYTWNQATGALDIPAAKVTGAISITIVGVESYGVSIDEGITHGSVNASPTSAASGATVSLTAEPDWRYLFGSWSVTYVDGEEVEHEVTVTDNQFTMPAYDVTVNATFITDTRKHILYLTTISESNTKSSDKLYAALNSVDTYKVYIEAPNTQTITNYDLVVLHESIGGTSSASAVTGCKTGNVAVLNTKSFFYGETGDNTKRWGWGKPHGGRKTKAVHVNTNYVNIKSHPLFAGLTPDANDSIQILSSIDSDNKPIQPIASFTSGKEGTTLAQVPDGTAIHELTPTQRGASSGLYLLISVYNKDLNNLNEAGQQLFKNAAAYLIAGTGYKLIANSAVSDCWDNGEYKCGDVPNFNTPDPEGTGDWGTASNWGGGKTPTSETNVVLPNDITIGTGVTALAKEVIVGDGAKLTVADGGALVVADGISLGSGSDITLGSSLANGNATLIYDVTTGLNATVEMASKATTTGTNWTWQYIGSPVNGVHAEDMYTNGYLYKWNNGWSAVAAKDNLEAFAGYCVTYSGAGHVFEMSGTLTTTTSKTINVAAETAQVIGNSWTAPIQIKQMDASDFNQVEQTIYLFNTGSDVDGTGGEAGSSDRYAAGTYQVLPISSVKSGAITYTTSISALQGFFVKNETNTNGSITLSYSKHVRPTGENSVINGPMHAPKRITAEDSPMQAVAKLTVSGTRYDDQLVLIENDNCSAGFDNGWDGEKIGESSVSPWIYALRADGTHDAVSATNDLEGTVIGFRAGTTDSQYTMHFDYSDEAEELYLYDTETNTYTQVLTDNTYTFTTSDKEEHARFTLLRADAPQIATGMENVQSDDVQCTEVRKVMMDGELYIIRAGHIYNAQGAMVK